MTTTKLLVALTTSLFACQASVQAEDPWRLDPLWDDGNAEFAAYNVTWPRYGAERPGTAIMVVVKEPWAPDLDVKADTPRADGFDVLKFNHQRDVQTGIYAYHQMASVFVRRDSGELVKLATTSSEACGITTAELVDGQLSTSSYFDGQGRRQQPWEPTAVAEDTLPLVLRSLVRDTLPQQLSVVASLLSSRLPDLTPVPFDLSRAAIGVITVPAGDFEAVRLTLRNPTRRLEFDFEAAAPHRLLRSLASDGTRYELAKVERLPYWSLSRPGDERWLP